MAQNRSNITSEDLKHYHFDDVAMIGAIGENWKEDAAVIAKLNKLAHAYQTSKEETLSYLNAIIENYINRLQELPVGMANNPAIEPFQISFNDGLSLLLNPLNKIGFTFKEAVDCLQFLNRNGGPVKLLLRFLSNDDLNYDAAINTIKLLGEQFNLNKNDALFVMQFLLESYNSSYTDDNPINDIHCIFKHCDKLNNINLKLSETIVGIVKNNIKSSLSASFRDQIDPEKLEKTLQEVTYLYAIESYLGTFWQDDIFKLDDILKKDTVLPAELFFFLRQADKVNHSLTLAFTESLATLCTVQTSDEKGKEMLLKFGGSLQSEFKKFVDIDVFIRLSKKRKGENNFLNTLPKHVRVTIAGFFASPGNDSELKRNERVATNLLLEM